MFETKVKVLVQISNHHQCSVASPVIATKANRVKGGVILKIVDWKIQIPKLRLLRIKALKNRRNEKNKNLLMNWITMCKKTQ